MIGVVRSTLLALAACVTWVAPLAAETPALIDAAPASSARIEPVAASHGMVVAQETRAARIGVEILEQGGNAVDAAVATGLALAVTYPRAGNIGGGGYMLIHFAGGKGDTAIAREGPTAFYRGAIADKLVAAVRAAGGIMTRDDLERYRPIERTPTAGSYRGYRIVSMPPSSSGGVALIE